MGVIDKLNALDERAGVGRGPTQRSWASHTRWWWLHLVGGLAFLVMGLVWDIPGFRIFAVCPAFPAGFFHNERMREIGRSGQFLGYRRRSRERAPAVWARSTRQWWQMLAVGATFAIVAVFTHGSNRWIAFPAFVTTFRAGFFYNERLREIGRRSRIPAYRAPA